ncbi:transposase domain-containing protein [Microvirgula aerodenitrificans]|uniref:transposase domain-containing protein n=1 Tax=Microvirgula aerodenitrificans TaxID=57480 RepID=UPI002F41F295
MPGGSGAVRAIDYSLLCCEALVRNLDNDEVPTTGWITRSSDGCSNWLFASLLRGEQRATAIMSLIQSARLNGHDPYAYLRDVITRLPIWRQSRRLGLLPHRWLAAG